MPAIRKRYRVESTARITVAPSPPRRERARSEQESACDPASGKPAVDGGGAWDPSHPLGDLGEDLYAMRAAIVTTKREIGEIQRSPSGSDGMHRAAGELDAVFTAAERATTTILGAVEEIELSASILRSPASETARQDAAAAIEERVLLVYEACNFQDIAGQRIRKVLATLRFVEERLDRVIAAWNEAAPSAGKGGQAAGAGDPSTLLRGPGLPDDEGFVSQSEVDAFFA